METIKAQNANDQKLLEGLARSDRQAIEAIYALALPAVVQWVQENNGTEADARDIFQEALIALFRKVEQEALTLSCTLKSFIRIMCRNLWLNRLRSKSYKIGSLEHVEPVELGESLEQKLVRSEQEQLYFKYFGMLGEKCQKILQLFFDKVSLKEIANRLDTSENYIKKRKFICKEKLISNIQADPIFKELNTK